MSKKPPGQFRQIINSVELGGVYAFKLHQLSGRADHRDRQISASGGESSGESAKSKMGESLDLKIFQ